MLFLINWICFGIIVAWISRHIMGVKKRSIIDDIFIAICGSCFGGVINYCIGNGESIFQTSGIFMSILGSCLLLYFSNKIDNKKGNNDDK